MRFLISGASGVLGTYFAPFLAAHGHEVRTLVRHAPQSVTETQWDPGAGALDPSALNGVDVVINLSGANLAAQRWTPQFKRELVESRVQPTRLLAESVARCDAPPMLVFISAVGWYGHRDPADELTEASDPGSGFIAELARDWEAAADVARVPVLHPRLGVVLGPGGMLAQLVPLFRKGLGGRLGSGRQMLSWIALDDLGPALLHCMAHRLTGPVNFTAPNPVTNSEFAQQLAELLHRPSLVNVPAFALRAAVGEMAEELLSGQCVVPRRLLDSAYGFAYPNLRDALEAYVPDVH